MNKFTLNGIEGFIDYDAGMVRFGSMSINLNDALSMASELGKVVRFCASHRGV